ncbi:alpha/beta hydrolase family protein [Janthinobacterium lividum]|uniref:alpha/beta hydrolase family protein n=1 Tax=Janthinobacterium lividum TaxID=29581 RepID=UPI00140B71DD|nr:alpha/beta hydrolase [Janthinobacterium lividum]
MTSFFLWPLLAVSLTATGASMPEAFSPAPCETGIFRQDQTGFVSVTKGGKGYGYTFSDGIVGNTLDAGALVACGKDAVLVRGNERWPKVALAEADTRFESDGVMLAGRLMEAPGAGKDTPLVVYAHGSEGTGWIDRARDPYQMLGRGVSVFVYDKRGTGLSEGEYTQNFPRLADDLVAASREAKRLAQGRYGRFGLLGVSQGGWIVPLAQVRAKAEFIGIGYGLAVDITEQDAAQVARELQDKGYGGDVIAQARTLTDITARIVKSGYNDGLDELSAFQQQFGREPWFSLIKGGYTGVLLGMPADELRKHGIPRFDKLDIDWSIDPVKVLSQVTVPQLWALAEDDRQAPPAVTVERLMALRGQGQAISVYLFPQADHGMRSYAQAPDGTRKSTVITPGFYELMADWAKGGVKGAYGTAYRK